MDNRGLVDISILRAKKNDADFTGTTAYCFIDGNKIIKVYAVKIDKDYECLNVDDICDLSMFEADTIVFPDEYIYENGKKAGEIMKYVADKDISQSFNNRTNVSKLIIHYENVVNDIMTYSNIGMYDLCFCNVLYSNKRGFHIIDTTRWKLEDNSTKSNLYCFNNTILSELLFKIDIQIAHTWHYSYIENQNFIQNISKYGKAGQELKNLLERNLHCDYHIVDLLYWYNRLSMINQGQELKTLGEMKEFTKILKKG